jgi:hypothetical protein
MIAGALALARIIPLVATYLRLLVMDMVDVICGVGISSTIVRTLALNAASNVLEQ